MYGIKPSDLNSEILSEIFDLYSEIVGGNPGIVPAEHQLKELRERGGPLEWRFGSRLSLNSKLRVNTTFAGREEPTLSFSFFDNLANGDPREEKGQELAETFKQAVDDLLISKGLGVELPWWRRH